MTELERTALLPAGLRDMLPPDAAFEAAIIERLIAHVSQMGYARVKAPLVEFEDGLLSGPGAAMAAHTFRLMDPVSQRMMGVRADITPQIARIARTRLKNAARPLRLSYSGEVLRVKGSQLKPEREFAQVGVELIGGAPAAAAAADAEVIVMTAEALGQLGIIELSVDLNLSPLVPAVLDALGVPPIRQNELRAALDHKDAAAVAAVGGPAAKTLGALMAAAGPAERTLEKLERLELPGDAAAERSRLAEVFRLIRAAAPGLKLTIDPVERRGFEYHTGVGFTIYAPAAGGELGSGGRYLAADGFDGEPATGCTLYVDAILNALPAPIVTRQLFVPAETSLAQARQFRADGWITVHGLCLGDDPVSEAHRLGCSHVLIAGAVRPVPRS